MNEGMASMKTVSNLNNSSMTSASKSTLTSLSSFPLVSVISLLDEPQVEVCSHAIGMLLELVDFFWYEVSEATPKLIALAQTLPHPQPVWLLLSKYEKSVDSALKAEALFNLKEKSPFVETILAKAIDQYVSIRGASKSIEPALERLVERLISECLEAGEPEQVVGIAIEALRLDVLEAALKSAPRERQSALLKYAQKAALKHVASVTAQTEILKVVVGIAATVAQQQHSDFIFVADCLVAMNDAQGCARLLTRLIQEATAPTARAIVLQISFNLHADATRDFLNIVLAAVRNLDLPLAKEAVAILDGREVTRLQLEFLYRNNQTDMMVLERTKDALNPQNSMHHSILSVANALMHCGTTNDAFLRKNLDWLGHATNWAKFTAAASLGVIHRGQVGSRGRQILKPYLPTGDGAGSPFAEGGAMFALGLMNVRTGSLAEKEYFLRELSKTENETLQHGLCLGMGVLSMSTDDLELVDQLKAILYADNAVSGEAAAIAIGLILHSSGNDEVASELVQYAHQTQHEKVVRGLVLAVALIFGGLRERADPFIEEMLKATEPTLRYGAMITVASAFAGSSDNRAIARLLHTAVSDSSDDVRRVSVMALGFVLCRDREELPRTIELLTESYNPHVRYGSALALGIAYAGSADKTVIDMIRPMCKDFADYVRQGAYIALAMVMMQHNSKTCEEVNWARNAFETVIGTKHEDAMAKFGAIMAQGIIDAGGRASVVSLLSPSGHVNQMAVAGLLLFSQFWYWYPLAHFFSLALIPTGLVAVNDQMQMPQMEIVCEAKPSRFAPPPPIKAATVAAPKKLITAILSTTAKAAAKAKKAGRQSDMEVDAAVSQPMDVDPPAEKPTNEEDDKEKKESEAEAEPESHAISNLVRVTPLQLAHVKFPADGKYQPVTGIWKGEIVVVVDCDPKKPAEFITPSEIKINVDEDEKDKEKQKEKEKEKRDQPPANACDDDSDELPVPSPFEMKDQ